MKDRYLAFVKTQYKNHEPYVVQMIIELQSETFDTDDLHNAVSAGGSEGPDYSYSCIGLTRLTCRCDKGEREFAR